MAQRVINSGAILRKPLKPAQEQMQDVADNLEKLQPGIDDSPAIFSLTVTTHNNGTSTVQARVSSPTGWQNRSHALPGHLTARKLANAIHDITNW